MSYSYPSCSCEDRPACGCESIYDLRPTEEPFEPAHPHYCDCPSCDPDEDDDLLDDEPVGFAWWQENGWTP